MTPQEKARRLRPMIVKASAFLSDQDALNAIELYDIWMPDKTYEIDTRLSYDDKLYRVVQSHTSQADWTPDLTPALFTEVALPGEIPVWKQPKGAQDAYQKGKQVKYPDENGSVYESDVDNNVWAPNVHGWHLIS